jgi:hypothetical protein
MSGSEATQIREIVGQVQSWPAAMRVALARHILETLESPPVEQPPPKVPRGPSAAEIAAMFKTDRPAPSDEEVEHILEDELMGKYGS